MPGQLDIFEQDLAGLDPDEAEVWRVIREHRGRVNAVKVDTVAWRTGLPGVKVREVVSHLIRNHGKFIGSSTGDPPGFFIIEDKGELDEQIRSLRHRGIMCLVRAAELSKTSVEEVFGQARLDLKEDGDGV